MAACSTHATNTEYSVGDSILNHPDLTGLTHPDAKPIQTWPYINNMYPMDMTYIYGLSHHNSNGL